jgi:macrolide transport system ATP-binding/permease protein
MSDIVIRNLNFSYKTYAGEENQVLKDVNLDIGSGELVAIQGPSGSGKSTLFYIIGCLLKSPTGSVKVGGIRIQDLDDEQLAVVRNQKIGFVFQQFHLLPKVSVLENILLPSHYPSEAPPSADLTARATQLAVSLGLGERLHSYPNQLSGGQQQRVCIARALLNNTELILADEPTGSLDTQNSKQVMEILKQASRDGKTVVIITHDAEVAAQCDRVVSFRDGVIVNSSAAGAASAPAQAPASTVSPVAAANAKEQDADLTAKLSHGYFHKLNLSLYLTIMLSLFPEALRSLRYNLSRTLLTMLGIVIGVAAVLSMITLGRFTQARIMDSYAEMGVNTLAFYGYPNWALKATDQLSVVFQSFSWESDLLNLKNIFPKVTRLSPVLSSWDNVISFGGKKVDSDVRLLGISPEGLELSNRQVILGSRFSPFHVEHRSPVCLIGHEIYQRLFGEVSPLGQVVYVSQRDSSFGCRVLGVLSPQVSNKDWNKPNLQVYVPYTFFQGISNPWESRINRFTLQLEQGADVEGTGKKIKAYFQQKYGKSARIDIGFDSLLVAQMNKFLSLFTVLLGAIAFVSLAVGGIGITNMMLVSVTERFKEIGVRKAFGATNLSIRIQYLMESSLICCAAGLVGFVLGFGLYEAAIFAASKVVPQLKFEWVLDAPAILLSLVSILCVGTLSGLTPALKAERLQVIEALRSE